MTISEANTLVSSLRRRLLLADVTRLVLILTLAAGFAAMLPVGTSSVESNLIWTAGVVASLIWVLLTVLSVRALRQANHASIYLASGRLDLAKEQLQTAIRKFSLYGSGQLVACHNLAVLEHGQKNYRAAAELCSGVLSLRKRQARSLGKTCRMLLADCRLYLGDTLSALRAIEPLRNKGSMLSLSDELMLLPIELRCQVAQGDFAEATRDLSLKVRRAELLDAPRAALVHVLLARACRVQNMAQEASFLEGRARLYHDLGDLAEQLPPQGNSDLAPQSADNK